MNKFLIKIFALMAVLMIIGIAGCSSVPPKEINITEPPKTLGETGGNKIQTTAPNPESTTKPTSVPTTKPTSVPTTKPTSVPTTKPTSVPTTKPTSVPTTKPTSVPTTNPVHSHSYTTTIIKQATCTEDGTIQHVCSCGDIITESLEAEGHSYSKGKCIRCELSQIQIVCNQTFPMTYTIQSFGSNSVVRMNSIEFATGDQFFWITYNWTYVSESGQQSHGTLRWKLKDQTGVVLDTGILHSTLSVDVGDTSVFTSIGRLPTPPDSENTVTYIFEIKPDT